MNIHFISQASINYLSENLFSSLTTSQKQVAAIALAIFSCAALGYTFFRFCHFKAALLDSSEVNTLPESCFVQTLKDGRTKKVFNDGTMEVGQFNHQEELSGEGERICPDESLVDEDVKAYPEGYRDVHSLKGTFENGKLNGKGEILFSDGSLYTGTFKNDILIEGTKKYSGSTTDITYEQGKFVNNKLTGQGRIRLRDGKVMQGLFQAGILISETRNVRLLVKTMTGKSLHLNPTLDETVGSFKAKLTAQEGIPGDQMRLIYAGRQLDDDNVTLEKEDILDCGTIHLVLRLGGD